MAGNTIDNIRIGQDGSFSFKQNSATDSGYNAATGTLSTAKQYHMSNIGTGAQLFVGEDTVGESIVFRLKTISGGEGIKIVPTADGLTISADVTATGVARFTELLDAPQSYVGRAGRYLAVKSDESGIDFVQPPNKKFTDMSDVPGTYSGNNNRYVRVNSAGTGLEFVNLPNFSNVNYFIQLQDVPNNYAGHAGEMLVVNATADGLEYKSVSAAGVSHFADLLDGPGALTGNDNRFVAVNSTGTALVYQNKPSYTFLENTDTPASYTGHAGHMVVVNASGNGLDFVAQPTPALKFIQLQDAPNNFAGQASKIVRVKGDESGLEFYTLPAAGATAFTGLSDVPANYAGNGGRGLRVKSDATGLEFYALPSVPARLTDLADFPGTYQASKWLQVNAGGTGVQLVDLPNFSYVRSFKELNDVPSNYTSQAGRYLRVKSDVTGLEFADLPAPSITFSQLTDAPANYTGAAGKYVKVKSTGDGVEFGDLPSLVTKFTDLTDAPATLTASKYLQVNSAGTAINLVDLPAGVTKFNQLSDVPTSYSGSGGKLLAVKTDASGLEFVSTPATNVSRYTFRINFSSTQNVNTTNESGLPAVQDLPNGWSLISASGSSVTLQTDKTVAPLAYYIAAWDSSNNRWRQRYNLTLDMYVTPSTINQFTITGTSLTASGVGATAPGYCLVTMIF